jgi:spore coat polysaccharide biosynthesis protein SpsF
MRTVAIVQARMGSSRLPGKVLKPLAGKPVLWHIIHRLRKCRQVDAIAIATSTQRLDDAIQEFAVGEGVEVVRGPEDNVLARYALAAEKLAADIIVRVTGDAPLIDPVTIDCLIRVLIENEEVEYCVGDSQVPCIHEGFTPFKVRTLRRLVCKAGDDPVAREHVTGYLKQHPEFAPTAYVPIEPDYQFSGARMSVDTPADLRFLEEVYTRLNVPAGEADVRDVVRLLRSSPDLLRINAHIHQKDINEQNRRVLFRCDGDAELGLGHIYRCLALADELREAHGWGVSFAMSRGAIGFELVSRAGYPIDYRQDNDEETWLAGLIGRLRPDLLVLDVRSDLASSSVQNWRNDGLLVITLDDASERRLAADLAFYPPVPQVQRLSWTGFTGQLYVGWEWVVLRREFGQRENGLPNERPVVLLTMGGSDPKGLTLKALKALDLLDEDFQTIVLLGPGFSRRDALNKLLLTTRRHFEVRENIVTAADLMNQADLAVASFGVTAYELAAMGVPSILLCLTEDHAESASAFAKAEIAVSLGLHQHVTEDGLAEAVRALLSDASRRGRARERGMSLVDGHGAERVARVLMEAVLPRTKHRIVSPSWLL